MTCSARSFSLRFSDPGTAGGRHLPSFAPGGFGGVSGWGMATVQDGPKFGNLTVDTEFLLFKTFDRGGQDFSSEFCCWHVSVRLSNLFHLGT